MEERREAERGRLQRFAAFVFLLAHLRRVQEQLFLDRQRRAVSYTSVLFCLWNILLLALYGLLSLYHSLAT